MNDQDRLNIFTNAADKVIPDPLVYRQWFAAAGEKRQRIAVGTRRYSTVQDILGAKPQWEDFLDPQTGELLTIERLKAEDRMERSRRIDAVRQQLTASRKALKQTGVYGFSQ